MDIAIDHPEEIYNNQMDVVIEANVNQGVRQNRYIKHISL